MAAVPKNVEPYGLDPVFEKAVVTLMSGHPRFFGRIGHHIDPELLKNKAAQLAARAAHAIAKDVGHGPSNPMLVIQRLRAWMHDGKVKLEEVKKVAEMFDTAEDNGLPEVEGAIAELTPIIQQRLRDQAMQVGIEAFGQKRDLSKVIELETKAARVGQVDTSIGTIMGEGSWAEVNAMRDIERLPTGVLELDTGLGGGLQRGGLGMFIGGAGDGKSMGLNHVSGFNLLQGAFVGYATLELPRAEIFARIKANVTGIPIDIIKQGKSPEIEAAMKRLRKRIGPLIVRDFTPLTTTVEDIREWVKACEEHVQRKMDLLVVDYADKVGAKKSKKGSDDESGYTAARVVYEGLRIWSEEEKRFCWTASQATRRKDRKKKLDLDDTADSMHKVRVCDLAITLNVDDEQMKLFVAKHRTGKARFDVGPFPTAFEIGQLIPM